MIITDNSSTFWALVACFLVGIPSSLILGLWIGGKALRAMRSGVAVSSSRAEYRRAETPSLYWLTLSLQAFNATACLLIALALTVFAILFILSSLE